MDELLKSNINIVYAQLHKFNLADDDDAFSYALEALWRAAQTFDESMGYAFSTYAYACVYNGIAMYLRKRKPADLSYEALVEKRQLRVAYEEPSITCDEILAKVMGFIAEVKNENHRKILEYWASTGFEARQSDIAEVFGVSQAHVSRVINAFRAKYRKELLYD